MRTPSYSLPPEPVAPTAEETRAQAEAAAQLEKENLKKKRRPTLLTGYGGVASAGNMMQSTLSGKGKLGE